MRIRLLILVAITMLLGCSQDPVLPPAPADITSYVHFRSTISDQEKQHLLDAPCSVITSTAAMPQKLKEAFTKGTTAKQFELADPGKKFQVTDVVAWPRLPSRRLVFAGSCGDRWFIHYERGGIGLTREVVVLRPDSGGLLQFVWGGTGFKVAKSIEDLRSAISSRDFADDREYSW